MNLYSEAQQSVHLTLGILRTSQAFLYALAFFWLDGFAVPAPAQVTQSVGLLEIFMPKSLTVINQSVENWNKHHTLASALTVFQVVLHLGEGLNFHDFSSQELDTIDFSADVISCSLFQNTRLAYARFCETRLGGTSFQGANLTAADFSFAWCDGTGNSGDAEDELCASQSTSFSNAILDRAIFHNAHLTGVDFRNTSLIGTKFINCNLDGARFNNATLENTVFSRVDFSNAQGLDTVVHKGSSYLDVETLIASKGNLSEKFLRGCGIPNQFIEYLPSLVSGSAIQYYSCFISYSSTDEGFARRLHADLQDNGVRCWFAPENLKIGAKIRPAIDQSIRLHDKLLIILSENSIRSQWVENEIETALEKERKDDKVVLFPVRVDDTVMKTNQSWAAYIRNTRNIGDFSSWKEHDMYEKSLKRLLESLKASE